MDIPIVTKYDNLIMSTKNQNIQEHVRILDIDGIFLISIMIREKESRAFIEALEIAFDTLNEAKQFLEDEMGLEFEDEKIKQKWRDYDVY